MLLKLVFMPSIVLRNDFVPHAYDEAWTDILYWG